MNSKTPKFLQLNANQKQLFACFFLVIFFSSCLSHKPMINFRSGEEKKPTLAGLSKQEIANKSEIVLQPNDVIAMIVTSPDGGMLTVPYNLVPSQISSQNSTGNSPANYIVDEKGMIVLPSIGSMKAEGLTVSQLKDSVTLKISKYVDNPSVNIRLINFKINVIGEVTHPGTIQIENERITILEALARAGDLTPYSDRTHIMVIREKDGKREFGEINLKSTDFFTSKFYYLEQNDVIYIEPLKGKIAQIQQPVNTYLQPIQVAISVIAILVALLKK
jgi:polysaccharide biosynthesis/export protein